MRDRLRTLLIRSAFLFLLSLVLVAGFWFHREFYQIGFANLLIIGGVVPFLLIWAARLPLSREFPPGPPPGGPPVFRRGGGRPPQEPRAPPRPPTPTTPGPGRRLPGR